MVVDVAYDFNDSNGGDVETSFVGTDTFPLSTIASYGQSNDHLNQDTVEDQAAVFVAAPPKKNTLLPASGVANAKPWPIGNVDTDPTESHTVRGMVIGGPSGRRKKGWGGGEDFGVIAKDGGWATEEDERREPRETSYPSRMGGQQRQPPPQQQHQQQWSRQQQLQQRHQQRTRQQQRPQPQHQQARYLEQQARPQTQQYPNRQQKRQPGQKRQPLQHGVVPPPIQTFHQQQAPPVSLQQQVLPIQYVPGPTAQGAMLQTSLPIQQQPNKDTTRALGAQTHGNSSNESYGIGNISSKQSSRTSKQSTYSDPFPMTSKNLNPNNDGGSRTVFSGGTTIKTSKSLFPNRSLDGKRKNGRMKFGRIFSSRGRATRRETKERAREDVKKAQELSAAQQVIEELNLEYRLNNNGETTMESGPGGNDNDAASVPSSRHSGNKGNESEGNGSDGAVKNGDQFNKSAPGLHQHRFDNNENNDIIVNQYGGPMQQQQHFDNANTGNEQGAAMQEHHPFPSNGSVAGTTICTNAIRGVHVPVRGRNLTSEEMKYQVKMAAMAIEVRNEVENKISVQQQQQHEAGAAGRDNPTMTTTNGGSFRSSSRKNGRGRMSKQSLQQQQYEVTNENTAQDGNDNNHQGVALYQQGYPENMLPGTMGVQQRQQGGASTAMMQALAQQRAQQQQQLQGMTSLTPDQAQQFQPNTLQMMCGSPAHASDIAVPNSDINQMQQWQARQPEVISADQISEDLQIISPMRQRLTTQVRLRMAPPDPLQRSRSTRGRNRSPEPRGGQQRTGARVRTLSPQPHPQHRIRERTLSPDLTARSNAVTVSARTTPSRSRVATHLSREQAEAREILPVEEVFDFSSDDAVSAGKSGRLPWLKEQEEREKEKEKEKEEEEDDDLPMLVDWRMLSDGGISGRVYGSKYVSDGEFIETSPVVSSGRLARNKNNLIKTTTGKRFVLSAENDRDFLEGRRGGGRRAIAVQDSLEDERSAGGWSFISALCGGGGTTTESKLDLMDNNRSTAMHPPRSTTNSSRSRSRLGTYNDDSLVSVYSQRGMTKADKDGGKAIVGVGGYKLSVLGDKGVLLNPPEADLSGVPSFIATALTGEDMDMKRIVSPMHRTAVQAQENSGGKAGNRNTAAPERKSRQYDDVAGRAMRTVRGKAYK